MVAATTGAQTGTESGAGPSPEFQVLVDCVGGAGAWPGDAPPAAGLDWDQLRFLAARLRVFPLLWAALRGAPQGVVPPAVLEQARADFEPGAARSLELTGELLRVSAALEGAGIKAIAYKGPVLADRIYDNVAMRVFKDLDLVVPPDQLDAARDVLLRLGYRDLHPTSPAARRVLLRSAHELTLVDGDHVVELHWGVAPRQFAFQVDLPGLLTRARPATLQGRAVLVLAPEDELLLLCVHGARDRWQWLDNVASVDRLVALNPDLDWDVLEARAAVVGGRRMLLLGLALAADLLGTALPPRLTDRLRRDARLSALRAGRAAEMMRGDPPDPSPEGLRQVRFHLGVRERARDRVEYCLRAALTPNVVDCEVVSLPRPLGFLYYPVHVGRLVARYAPGARRWAG
jgi:hypothetical protein